MNTALFPNIVVNGETVPHSVVAAETQNHSAPAGKPGLAWRKAARAIALRTLLLQEARRRGLHPEPSEVAPGRSETDGEALVRALLDDAIVVEKPTEEDVRAEWTRDPSRFRAPPLWEVSHILVACDPRDSSATEAARARANQVGRRAAQPGTVFAKLAAEESDCSSKSSGGCLGQLGPGDTAPEFEAALKGMNEGDITSEPVLTRFGWHIIRIDAFIKGRPLPFEVVQGRIADALEKAAWTAQAREFVDGLVASAEVSGVDFRFG
ncbi:MAG: peptidylprolyl isomerase [Silicimonas sp.]|nr:peptidylprolyl isomerase [Silicimonas sp.]